MPDLRVVVVFLRREARLLVAEGIEFPLRAVLAARLNAALDVYEGDAAVLVEFS